MNQWLLGAVGWLIPGGGYLFTRRYLQFAWSFALICGAFVAGLVLQGGSLWIGPGELDGVDGFTAFIAQAGIAGKALAGLSYLLARIFYHSQTYVQGRVHEYGTTLLLCAGIMNLLALADAFELRGEKE
jgi:hypothetical protein